MSDPLAAELVKAVPRAKQSDVLLDTLALFSDIVVVAHTNPDPDAIAGGWGIHELIARRLGKPPAFVAGGAILRAENRHMIRLLAPPISFVDDLELPQNAAVVFVDCQPTSSNHILAGCTPKNVLVVDHHHATGIVASTMFEDRRTRAAAASSIVTSYLREQGLVPSVELASALLYGIRSETKGAETVYTRIDRRAVTWLSGYADHAKIAEIESAPLSAEYFGDLALALQHTFIYESVALCFLPRAACPEIVGEIADLLVRGQAISRVFCAAAFDTSVLVSVRTRAHGDDATALLLGTISGLGHGGGHAHRAGGTIPVRPGTGHVPESLEEELRGRWLSLCECSQRRGTRLVARREIVAGLE